MSCLLCCQGDGSNIKNIEVAVIGKDPKFHFQNGRTVKKQMEGCGL